MTDCRFCGVGIPDERVEETGYDHCSSRNCVITWRREQLEKFRLDLVPKSGFTISFAEDPNAKNIGKSSGRT